MATDAFIAAANRARGSRATVDLATADRVGTERARGGLAAADLVGTDRAQGSLVAANRVGVDLATADRATADRVGVDRARGGLAAVDLVAAPMHGELKLRGEGLRTRDGHLLEWLSLLRPTARIAVYSRPEPWPRVTLARVGGAPMPAQLAFVSPQPKTIPNLRHRRDWWVRSMRFMPGWPGDSPALIWNPIAGAAMLERTASDVPVAFDLLDDWLVHPAFARIAEQVERAYKSLFDRVSVVTANSEATLALAHRFGRDDAFLLRNGVDPERFALSPCAHKQVTVGYGGKLGFRVDVELVGAVARALPRVRFEFAGPVLSKEQARALRRIPNVVLLGDVRYDRYPSVMRKWDVAWAPHRLGEFEVGGDLIKLYEYRAAGLPTVSTRVIGWERALEGVRAVPRNDVARALAELVEGCQAGEIPREPVALPEETSWRAKAEFLLDRLGIGDGHDGHARHELDDGHARHELEDGHARHEPGDGHVRDELDDGHARHEPGDGHVRDELDDGHARNELGGVAER
jgi:glycosyltransferase involved in cell wall biosynthesis